MAGPVCVGAGVAKAIARCSHALCTDVALARIQDDNTQQLNEAELQSRLAIHLSYQDISAAFAMVSVAACGVMFAEHRRCGYCI